MRGKCGEVKVLQLLLNLDGGGFDLFQRFTDEDSDILVSRRKSAVAKGDLLINDCNKAESHEVIYIRMDARLDPVRSSKSVAKMHSILFK